MSTTTTTSPDYDVDLVAWAAAQAALLRAGRIAEADLANIAEELDDVGKAERLRLASHVGTVIEHLMKLEASKAREPRNGWRATIRRVRDDIGDVLAASPSLRRELPGIIARETARARGRVAQSLADYGEPANGLSALSYGENQILGPWLPN